jgi:hypothetical protein
MSCHLARALYDATLELQDWDVTEVVHIGTTVCRTISGTSTLSQHALGLAIDFAGFFDDGAHWFGVEDHWEHDTTSPVTPEGRTLFDIVWRWYERWIFNIILTPNYNAAHDNHFHVDLTRGQHGLWAVSEHFGCYLGVNPGDE